METLEITSKEFYSKIRPQWIEQSKSDEATFAKEISFAIQLAIKNPYLKNCEQTSVLRAIMNVAQIGLTLNPILKYAYLIPRYNGKTKQLECALEPSYIGLSKLATDSKAVRSIECQIIYEGDNCIIDMASESKIVKHEPYFLLGTQKGKIKGVYSLATLLDGSRHFEGMSYQDILEIRDRSESYKAFIEKKVPSCTWTTDEGEMCRKTVTKRHTKYLPKSGATEQLDQAISLDNEIHGFREEMDFGMLAFLETSLDRSTIDHDRKAKLKEQMSKWKFKDEAFKLLAELGESMPIMGLEALPTNVGDTIEATRNRVAREDFKERKK